MVYRLVEKEVICRNNFLKGYKLPSNLLVTDSRG